MIYPKTYRIVLSRMILGYKSPVTQTKMSKYIDSSSNPANLNIDDNVQSKNVILLPIEDGISFTLNMLHAPYSRISRKMDSETASSPPNGNMFSNCQFTGKQFLGEAHDK